MLRTARVGAGIRRHSSSAYSWAASDHVDRALCCDPFLVPSDLQVMHDVISEDEELRLADEAATLLRRRRYETDHWDQVIVNFKEMETSKWTAEAKQILAHLRSLPVMPPQLSYFPTVHVIDLAEEGYIKPHVDSIKFSGQIVAGISLLSPCVMRFQEEHGPSRLDVHLRRRSFYCMSGGIRYRYTHEILPGLQAFQGHDIARTRRISIMFRDVFDETAKRISEEMAAVAQQRAKTV
ncbi:hypothetical protein ACHHYP_13284 [Achlya hypogyna]|uniref:Alpha-ketoglutarate-dependent dioxygenase AlkB-like domain-containing protein n=1 Tax=Achlya hypogyna TaxID=1202772 RepID=A0A1V9YFQ0_ACHHY|nr:hypothetical protein ACHHYP_13284 [Achlya hypogyna]